MTRQDVIDLMHDMSNEVDVEELMHRLYMRKKVENAEAAIAAGDVLTEEEVDREIESWFVESGSHQMGRTGA